MSIWWLAPAFFAIIGLMSLFAGLGGIMRLKLVSGPLRFLTGALILAGAATIALFGLNLQTFSRLTHEAPAAEIELVRTGPSAFDARVTRFDAGRARPQPRIYPVTGDSVRLEADVVLFKPWVTIAGADALFRFNRIQGRFDSEAQEIATPPRPYSMRDSAGLDIFLLPIGPANPLQPVDGEFIDGFAIPMADGARYEVVMTQRGLVPRPANAEARMALSKSRGL
jgi:hypothetical protein